MFFGLGNAFAQLPGDLPKPMGFDPRHRADEQPVLPSAISKDVELVEATGGAVYDVFVFTSFSSLASLNRQDNYAYVCARGVLLILDVSEPSNPKKVGYAALP